MRLKKGFTLLEILVALAVLALALSAIVVESSNNIRNAATLRDKTLAHWVAMNKIAEIQINEDWPSTGNKKGEAEMADREWFWQYKITKTMDDDVRRMDVEVRVDPDKENPLATAVAFIGQPMK